MSQSQTLASPGSAAGPMYDANGECIGCTAVAPTLSPTAAGRAGECAPTCGFRTGTITAGMVLRAAAGRLAPAPHARPGRLAAALDAAASALENTVHSSAAIADLIEQARDALGAYAGRLAGLSVPGAQLVDNYASSAPRPILAEAMYLAADLHDGVAFEQVYREHLIGRALRELAGYWPDADRLLIAVTNSADRTPGFEFLGVMDPANAYEDWHFIGPDANTFDQAGLLVIFALTLSQPQYLIARPDRRCGVTHELRIAQTTYGKALRRQ